jgi:hypothetical protein
LICAVGDWAVSGNTVGKVLLLGAGIIAGLGVYLASCYWMKHEEMFFLLNIVKRKMKGSRGKGTGYFYGLWLIS